MAFDGIVTKQIVKELKEVLVNGKIDKIYEPSKNEIYLGIYSNGKNYLLNVSIDSRNYRLHLSTHQKENPKEALNFCMVLRKHISGSIIKDIYMNGLERIIYIKLETHSELNDIENKTLIIELMGRHSNIILLNSEDIVVDSFRHLSKLDGSNRNIYPNEKYENIDNSKKDFSSTSFEEFSILINNMHNANDTISLSEFISNIFNGISTNNLKHLLFDLNIEDNDFNEENIKTIYKTLKDFINDDFKNYECKKILISEEKEKYDYYISLSKNISNLNTNFVLDDFYALKEENEEIISYRNNVLKYILLLVSKYKERLKNIDIKLKECESMDKYKLYGELITSNLYKIPEYNHKEITLENFYDNNKEITINLNDAISPSQNAEAFFKKYRKLKNTYSIIIKQKELFNEEISYLDTAFDDIKESTTIDEIKNIYEEIIQNLRLEDTLSIGNTNNKKYKGKIKINNLPSTYTIDGFTILIGKNNKQNDNLTFKIAKPNDMWFHTKDIHGSHVVLKLDKSMDKYDQSKLDSIFYKCASFAAFYSKAKLSSNVPVDYTYIKNVKKPKGSNSGFAIYTNNKTLYVNPKKPE